MMYWTLLVLMALCGGAAGAVKPSYFCLYSGWSGGANVRCLKEDASGVFTNATNIIPSNGYSDIVRAVKAFAMDMDAAGTAFCISYCRAHGNTSLSKVQCYPSKANVSLGALYSVAIDVAEASGSYAFAAVPALAKTDGIVFTANVSSVPLYAADLPSMPEGSTRVKNASLISLPAIIPFNNSAFVATVADVAAVPFGTGYCQISGAPPVGLMGLSYFEFLCFANDSYVQASLYSQNSSSNTELFPIDFVTVAVSSLDNVACFAYATKFIVPTARLVDHPVRVYCTGPNFDTTGAALMPLFTNFSALPNEVNYGFILHDLVLEFSPSGIPCYALAFERIAPNTPAGQFFFEFKCGVNSNALVDDSPGGLLPGGYRVFDVEFIFLGLDFYCLAAAKQTYLDLFCGFVNGTFYQKWFLPYIPTPEYNIQVLMAKNPAEDSVCALGVTPYGGINTFSCVNLATWWMIYDLVSPGYTWWDRLNDRFSALDMFFAPTTGRLCFYAYSHGTIGQLSLYTFPALFTDFGNMSLTPNITVLESTNYPMLSPTVLVAPSGRGRQSIRHLNSHHYQPSLRFDFPLRCSISLGMGPTMQCFLELVPFVPTDVRDDSLLAAGIPGTSLQTIRKLVGNLDRFAKKACWASQYVTAVELHCFDSDCSPSDYVCMSQFPSFASSTIFVDVALVSSDTNVCIALVDISNSSLVCFPEPVELNSLSFALPTGYQLIALALSDVYNTVCYAAISLTNRFEVRCWNFLSPYAPFPIFSQDLAIQVNFSGSKVFIEVDDYLQRYCYAVAALDVSTGNSTVLFGCNSFSGFIVPVATVTQLSTVVSGFIRRMHLAMTEDGAPTLAVSVDPSGLSQSFGYAVPHGTATPTCVQGTVIDVDVFGEQLQNFNVSIIPLTPLPLANEFHLLIAGDGNIACYDALGSTGRLRAECVYFDQSFVFASNKSVPLLSLNQPLLSSTFTFTRSGTLMAEEWLAGSASPIYYLFSVITTGSITPMFNGTGTSTISNFYQTGSRYAQFRNYQTPLLPQGDSSCGTSIPPGTTCVGGNVYSFTDYTVTSTTTISQQISLNSNVAISNGAVLSISSLAAITGSLSVDSATLALGNSLFVGGGLALGQNSTLSLSNGASLNITGCANLSGVLTINVPSTQTSSYSQVVISTPCQSGSFSQIQAKSDTCSSATGTPTSGQANSLTVLINLDGCTQSFIPGVSYEGALAIVIVVPVIVLLIIIVAILLLVPATRRRIVPFRDRKRVDLSAARRRPDAAD